MANDLFGGLGGALGGLVGGLANSGLVPKDTPEGKLFAAQSELSGLQKQEADTAEAYPRHSLSSTTCQMLQ